MKRTTILAAPVCRCVLIAAAALAWTSFAAEAQTPCGDQVQVQPGDTLFSLAERCDTSVDALRRANPSVDARDMRVGLYLHVPGGAKPEPASSGRTYTFRPGDTLYSIAEILGVTVEAVLAANPGLDPSDIPIGTQIELPNGSKQPGEPAPGDATVSVAPQSGPVGTRVKIDASGFPPEAPVKVGGGPPDSEYTVLQEMVAGRDGNVDTVVRLPDYAGGNEEWVFVVSTQDNRIKAVSDPFNITQTRTGDGSAVELTGTISGEGVECPALRGDDGELYTLAGNTEGFGAGDRVTVEGRVAEASICMQGTTIDVSSIRAAR